MPDKCVRDQEIDDLDTPSAEPVSEDPAISVYRIGGLGLLAAEVAMLESTRRAFCRLSQKPEKRALAMDFSGLCVGWRNSIQTFGPSTRTFVGQLCEARTRPIFFMDPGCPFVSQDELEILALLRSLRHRAPQHWQRAASQLSENENCHDALIEAARRINRCAATLADGATAANFCDGDGHARTLH